MKRLSLFCFFFVFFFKSTRFYFNQGNDSCSHLPFTVVSCSSAKIYANRFHNKSNYSAMKREIWFKHAYITDCFLSPPAHTLSVSVRQTNHSLVHYCCVRQLLCAFQPVEKKVRRQRAEWNDDSDRGHTHKNTARFSCDLSCEPAGNSIPRTWHSVYVWY